MISDPQIASIICHEGRTEGAFTSRVHRRFGFAIRYVIGWKKYLVWNGSYWDIDDGVAIDAKIRDEAKQLFTEASERSEELDSDQWRDLVKYAKHLNSSKGKNAIRDLLRSEPGVALQVDQLDQCPALLNCRNIAVDLRNGKTQRHEPDLLLTRSCPIDYDPNATCPTWLQFLEDVFPNEELRDGIQKVVGYSITGTTREQKLFILYGNGANGKTTFVETVLAMLGSYATSAAPDLLMVKGDSHPTELAGLYGHRFIVASETEEGRRLAEARVKAITGGDRITARRMKEDFWSFIPTHKIFLLTNHRPQLRGTDVGIRRRLYLIPFERTFTAEEQDKGLTNKLRRELPGILAWAVRGAIRWAAEGLGEPEAVRLATADYVNDQDTLGQFIAESCVTSSWAKVRASALYDLYRRWCESHGEQHVNMRRFGQSIDERGFRKRVSNGTWYEGIGVKDLEGLEPLEGSNG